MAKFKTPLGIEIIVDREDIAKIKEYRLYEVVNFRCSKKGMKKEQSRLLHHILLGIEKIPPGHVVDHVNGNPLDCRKSNLRLCTKAENSYNVAARKKYKGVYLGKTQSGRLYWQASITKDGKRIKKTCYSEKAAVEFYNQKAKELFGEFARLNVWRGPSRRVKKADLAPRFKHRSGCECKFCRNYRKYYSDECGTGKKKFG